MLWYAFYCPTVCETLVFAVFIHCMYVAVNDDIVYMLCNSIIGIHMSHGFKILFHCMLFPALYAISSLQHSTMATRRLRRTGCFRTIRSRGLRDSHREACTRTLTAAGQSQLNKQ